MFGSPRFENPYDPDDDGSDVQITEDDVTRSDDQGRTEAEAFVGQMGTRERNQDDRNFRRWLLRSAKKALAEGAERRRNARKKEKARLAAEAEAARGRAENAQKAEKSKRAFERYCRESDERWARLDEQTRAAEAEWEAGRPLREAAERAATANHINAKAKMAAGKSMTSTAPSCAAGPALSRAWPAHPAPRPTGSTAPTPHPTTAGASASCRGQRPTAPAPAPRSATPPTTASAPKVQRREAPSSIKLNPPPTLAAFAPPAVAAPPRPAPPSARPIPATPPPRSTPRPSPSSETRRFTPTRVPILSSAASQPLPPPPPPAAAAPPEPPPFTGADLAAYRASLGLSQGALAERLRTTQGTVSKAEGNPTALLGPTLRSAMWDAQRSAGGASR